MVTALDREGEEGITPAPVAGLLLAPAHRQAVASPPVSAGGELARWRAQVADQQRAWGVLTSLVLFPLRRRYLKQRRRYLFLPLHLLLVKMTAQAGEVKGKGLH